MQNCANFFQYIPNIFESVRSTENENYEIGATVYPFKLKRNPSNRKGIQLSRKTRKVLFESQSRVDLVHFQRPSSDFQCLLAALATRERTFPSAFQDSNGGGSPPARKVVSRAEMQRAVSNFARTDCPGPERGPFSLSLLQVFGAGEYAGTPRIWRWHYNHRVRGEGMPDPSRGSFSRR